MTATKQAISEASSSRFARVTEDDIDLQIHYNDFGRKGAKTIVMLHGSAPGESGWGSFKRNVNAFVDAGYRVVLMDCPGWNKSDSIVCKSSRSELNAHVVKGLLDSIRVQRAHVIGDAMGGESAVAFAHAYKDRVGKLVLIGGGADGPSHFSPTPTEGIKLLDNLYREPTLDNLKRMLNASVFDSNSLTEELMQTRLRETLARSYHLENFVASLAVDRTQFPDVDPLPGEISAPALVIWGRDDRFAPVDIGIRLVSEMPNADLHIFGRCGHWAQWEHAKKFNRLTLGFFDK